MLGPTHVVIGVAAGLAVAGDALQVDWSDLTTLSQLGWIVTLAALGALLPDIDTGSSTISRFLWLPRLLLSPLFALIPHRGPTHSLLMLVPLSVIFALHPLYGPVFVAGYASHIMADMLTKSGVKLLYPLPYNARLLPKFAAIRTGGLVELAVLIGMTYTIVDAMFLQ